MTKKPAEPDELHMPADKFDEMMRRALGTPSPAQSKQKKKPKPKSRTQKGKKPAKCRP
jgi:hypothetical protein